MDDGKCSVFVTKDAEGTPCTLMRSFYKGEEITYFPGIQDLPYILNHLELHQVAYQNCVWLIGYPSSGNNWLYEIISILLSGELKPAKLFRQHGSIGMIAHTNDLIDKQRVVCTHLRKKYMPLSILEKAKVIYVLRNPKSVATSSFCYFSTRTLFQYEGTFRGFLPFFIEGTDLYNGNWFQHVTEYWSFLKDRPNAMVVFYEDLRRNPVKVNEELSCFLELSCSQRFLEGVSQLTTIDAMKEGAKSKDGYQEMVEEFKTNHEQFVRKGTIDNWNNYFTVEQNEEFDELYNQKMADYLDLKEKIQFQ